MPRRTTSIDLAGMKMVASPRGAHAGEAHFHMVEIEPSKLATQGVGIPVFLPACLPANQETHRRG